MSPETGPEMSPEIGPEDLRDENVEPVRQLSVPHLVMGLVFLGIAGAWALHAARVIESVEVQWILPLILVVAGAAGLLGSLARGSRRRDRTPRESP